MKNPLDLHLMIYLHQKQQKIEKHKNCFKILQERRHVVVIESGKSLTIDLVTLNDDDILVFSSKIILMVFVDSSPEWPPDRLATCACWRPHGSPSRRCRRGRWGSRRSCRARSPWTRQGRSGSPGSSFSPDGTQRNFLNSATGNRSGYFSCQTKHLLTVQYRSDREHARGGEGDGENILECGKMVKSIQWNLTFNQGPHFKGVYDMFKIKPQPQAWCIQFM